MVRGAVLRAKLQLLQFDSRPRRMVHQTFLVSFSRRALLFVIAGPSCICTQKISVARANRDCHLRNCLAVFSTNVSSVVRADEPHGHKTRFSAHSCHLRSTSGYLAMA